MVKWRIAVSAKKDSVGLLTRDPPKRRKDEERAHHVFTVKERYGITCSSQPYTTARGILKKT